MGFAVRTTHIDLHLVDRRDGPRVTRADRFEGGRGPVVVAEIALGLDVPGDIEPDTIAIYACSPEQIEELAHVLQTAAAQLRLAVPPPVEPALAGVAAVGDAG